MKIAKNTAPKQRGRPFPKGRSGNPAGKPRGARNRATLAAETLLDGETEGLTRKAIELALAGDVTALRLCLDRIISPRRDRPIKFSLPMLSTAADALAAINAITKGVMRGELTDSEAKTLLEIVGSFREVLSLVDYEARLTALEQRLLERTS